MSKKIERSARALTINRNSELHTRNGTKVGRRKEKMGSLRGRSGDSQAEFPGLLWRTYAGEVDFANG
jgi:hypothetical protein